MASFGHLSVRIWIRQLSNPETPSQSYGRFTSRWLHLETVRSRFGLSRFQVHRHIKKTIADFVPDGFIRTPFCPDLDQAIFEPRYIFPKSHCRFASRLLHLDAVLPGSGSGHFRIRRRTPKTIADVAPDGFIWTPFCEDLDQAIFESGDTIPKQTCPACPALRPALPAYLPCLLADGRISGRAGQMCLLQTNVASDCFPRLMAIALPPNRIQLS